MRNINHKYETMRTAVAESFVVMSPELRDVVRSRKTEKGDALEIARVAAVMGAKKTWEIIPFCHQIPMTQVDVDYGFEDDGIRVRVTAGAVATTGVEMEAMTAASVCALTLYDMLKPYDAEVEISYTRLLEKRGGKSDFRAGIAPPARAAVIVVNGSVASGKKDDSAGEAVRDALRGCGVEIVSDEVIGDDAALLRERVTARVDEVELLLTVGGTGLGAKDIAVDTIAPMIERDVPGIIEAARTYGQRRTPRAMLSRGVSGLIGDTIVLTVPGSTGGARETMDALFPALLHAVGVMRKDPHAG